MCTDQLFMTPIMNLSSLPCALRPASSTLVAKDSTTLQSDEDKLNHWAEEVVNCQADVNVVSLEDLPIASPLDASPLDASPLDASSDTSLSGEDLSSPLSEEEIQTGTLSGWNHLKDAYFGWR